MIMLNLGSVQTLYKGRVRRQHSYVIICYDLMVGKMHVQNSVSENRCGTMMRYCGTKMGWMFVECVPGRSLLALSRSFDFVTMLQTAPRR